MFFRVPGPCTVSWGGSSAIKTKAGVIIRSTPNWVPIIDDEHGAEPADFIWAGRVISIECVGVNVDAITTAGLFINSLGAGKNVGEIISGENLTPKSLVVTERDTEYWEALNTEPLPPELALQATRELPFPLAFLLLPDINGVYFNHIPSYIVT